MTINFAKNWIENSWHKSQQIPEQTEAALIREMIRNCNNATVTRYATAADGGQVYVCTGLHSSTTERTDHVTLRLGLDKEPWSSAQYPAATAHIRFVAGMGGNPPTYQTDLFHGHGRQNTAATVF